MANPKIEFFRFKLKHKTDENKTFRQFMLENRKCKIKDSDSVIFANIYSYFMNKLTTDFAKNDSIMKVMTLISNKRINKHLDKKPQPDFNKHIIAGVLNGGTYGKERILAKLGNKNELNSLAIDQPVLQYYYIFLYLPLNHNEGFMMVHTDSADESISNFARKYISEIFSIGDYQKPTTSIFAPKHFQDEYRKGAVLKKLSFQTTFVDNQMENDDPIKDVMEDYDVKVSITPRGDGDKSIGRIDEIIKYAQARFFGTVKFKKQLSEFDKCSVSTKNVETKSSKVFDWNLKDQDIRPVVYLKGRVNMNDDGTVNLAALDKYCKALFDDYIKMELRPNLQC